MKDMYESPLCSRYASREMQRLFSPDMRIQTWRRLWVELARAEHALGLPVTEEQVRELEAHIEDIDYDMAAAREREVLSLLGRGRTATYIAEELGISYNTAKGHIKNLYAKCGVHSQRELIDLEPSATGGTRDKEA